MDAPAALLVRLPQPAAEFTVQIGIDNNANTQAAPHTSSACFQVSVAGRRVYSSPVCRLRDGPLAVRVPLAGAREFLLETDDGGDGRSHDQCVWADASVSLADGSTEFLDRLPLAPRHANRSSVPLAFSYDGQPSEVLLPTWERAQRDESRDGGSRRTIRSPGPRSCNTAGSGSNAHQPENPEDFEAISRLRDCVSRPFFVQCAPARAARRPGANLPRCDPR